MNCRYWGLVQRPMPGGERIGNHIRKTGKQDGRISGRDSEMGKEKWENRGPWIWGNRWPEPTPFRHIPATGILPLPNFSSWFPPRLWTFHPSGSSFFPVLKHLSLALRLYLPLLTLGFSPCPSTLLPMLPFCLLQNLTLCIWLHSSYPIITSSLHPSPLPLSSFSFNCASALFLSVQIPFSCFLGPSLPPFNSWAPPPLPPFPFPPWIEGHSQHWALFSLCSAPHWSYLLSLHCWEVSTDFSASPDPTGVRHGTDRAETAGNQIHRSWCSERWHFGWEWGGAGERQ